ncbi:type II toxin-antitoxin system toxin RelE3 [Algoriphagus sp. oki45]|uniref:type II toxin-antitoxin system RelE family toxin n=1 Tax=Algoriphagus sp. oki45 TaxID=3067294 RepID=UPI0027FE0730|nr:type II toxin-antitoxin system toxin RelE3 [Algoriphagus sp. oki45]
MKVLFLEAFEKDLRKIHDKKVLRSIKDLIQKTEQVGSIKELSGLKKLVGFKDAFRVRLGNYRVGIFLDGETVTFARIAHRKDIYSIFP